MQATAGEDPRAGGYSLGRNDVRTLSFLLFVVGLRILLWGQQVTLPVNKWPYLIFTEKTLTQTLTLKIQLTVKLTPGKQKLF